MQAEHDAASLSATDQFSFSNLEHTLFEIIQLTQRARDELFELVQIVGLSTFLPHDGKFSCCFDRGAATAPRPDDETDQDKTLGQQREISSKAASNDSTREEKSAGPRRQAKWLNLSTQSGQADFAVPTVHCVTTAECHPETGLPPEKTQLSVKPGAVRIPGGEPVVPAPRGSDRQRHPVPRPAASPWQTYPLTGPPTMGFGIESDTFRGPIDLLLFLVRRHEIDISTVGLASIADGYAAFLDVLKEIDINAVGDFVEVASRLVELKSRAVLPAPPDPDGELVEDADPRENLVERLLLYKQFRDASVLLEEQSDSWQRRYPRLQDDLPPRQIDLAAQPLQTIELWDLVSAFGRVLRDNVAARPEKVIYDETPIGVYMRRIHRQIVDNGKVLFASLFEPGMHKSAMVGVFLAVLELTRHHHVIAEQSDLYTDILISGGEGFSGELRLSDVDDYNPHVQGISSADPGSFLNRPATRPD